ncbi:phage portal protein [Corynebacterium lizhenjunii]|uniref:phage portal protein n=1 Tax=Corynebacterium lizhenjunii TaxID=2709394 RepID=UPI0013ECE0C3|nr:phage portal protein [Corynebacterium lizhenjunii]
MTVDAKDLAGQLGVQLARYRAKNDLRWRYYNGKAGVKNMGIAVPESLVNVESVVGWPEIVVDALAERIEWGGWRSGGDIDALHVVFAQNQLDVEVSKAILDALVTGVGFLAVSQGDVAAGEQQIIVDAVPATQATYVWDERRNRMAAGLVVSADESGKQYRTLYLPDETITLDGEVVVSRVVHNRGRCGLVALPNRARSGSARGRSEITPAIRYYTDHGVRTILGMEYNREFYTTPQRYLTNVSPEQLGASEDPDAQEILELGWKVAMNKALIIPPGDPDDGEANPAAGQFNAASPAPYIDELRMLAQLVSAQSGVPAAYLGFTSDNPASADAIRAAESRLVKRAEMRQVSFGKALVNDLAYVCLSILDGVPPSPEVMAGVSSVWREASTPTLAATMDAMVKAVAAKIMPEHSEVVWDMLNFTEAQKVIMRRELAHQQARERVAALAAGQQQPVTVMDSADDEFVPGGDSSGV